MPIAAGRVLSIVSNLVLGVNPGDGSRLAFSVGSALGLGMYLACALGLLAFPAQRLTARQRVGFAGEAMTVLGCGALWAGADTAVGTEHRHRPTESAVVDDRVAIPALQKLRSYANRIAIDDFGTGFSSLQYLMHLPVDVLKVDRAFVAALDGTRHGSAITEAIIRLAQILDLTTVAEGVETTAQADELRRLGAAIGQGYLYAKPLTDEDLRAYLRDAERLIA